jgi:hypothetical protein
MQMFTQWSVHIIVVHVTWLATPGAK